MEGFIFFSAGFIMGVILISLFVKKVDGQEEKEPDNSIYYSQYDPDAKTLDGIVVDMDPPVEIGNPIQDDDKIKI